MWRPIIHAREGVVQIILAQEKQLFLYENHAKRKLLLLVGLLELKATREASACSVF